MPELPEVETIIRDLIDQNIVGRTIENVIVRNKNSLQNKTSGSFFIIKNQKIVAIYRRGKYIVFQLSNYHLLSHLRMTGKFKISNKKTNFDKHEQIIFLLDNDKTLSFHDTRKFGRIYLTDNPQEILSKLGVEPLSEGFSLSALEHILEHHKRMIKPLMLDQTLIAGLGNIYVDEALWLSQIHPQEISNKIPRRKIKRLHQAIKTVLRRGIKNSGTSLGRGVGNFYSLGKLGNNQDTLSVFGKTGLPCPRCKHKITKLIVGQRGTHICDKCQLKK